jgi:hypothetical protein
MQCWNIGAPWIDELLRHPPSLAAWWQEQTHADLAKLGLEFLNLVVREVQKATWSWL